MKTKNSIEALLAPKAKKQLKKGLSKQEERKFQNLIKLLKKEGIPRCPTCLEPMIKIDKYSYHSFCDCSKEIYGVMVG